MATDEFSEFDILYRINSHCLIGGISDADFRHNAQCLLEDIRGYFQGNYEVMDEFVPKRLDGCIDCHRTLEDKCAKDALDAERWRWLVAENNKGGSRAKFLICWWSKDGDGYESTTGTSIDGKDPYTIVRLIDQARTKAQ